ncbi:DEAD/DEAH box helicase [Candidatus Roizmanbacteria bacterium CG07_land_8_20_14_0_80_34_15]|uniref:DEAD/DEAH box helicase n=1 Tax=Candidatus Roizmanbacteria bacterium CG07_land_8_20_14_0_80_34_15 TaxID=1974849 RepID=A0A2M6YST1_9BACT|nr:MAG: DEAD/DEAH box helicase [Candidatus Roizmanbacteria bacterium CG07_land_8_20_14_0_80_34_15]
MYNRRFQTSSRFSRFSRPAGSSRFGSGGRGRGRGRGMTGGNIHEFIRRANVKNVPVSTIQAVADVLYSSLDLPETLKATIARHNYINLTPIQVQGIPAIRAGKDVIGIANTGTGKTAAFLIPLVENILKDYNYKALIISPTRELALQTRDELRKFSGNMPIYSTLCIGQSSMQMQISGLRHNPHVVVGTPGRLKDLINRGILKLGNFKMIILDETDQMLDMGFIHDIKEIISYLPAERQSLFFSATITPVITALINSFVKNAVTISVKTQETLTNIKQDLVRLDKKVGAKMDKLSSLLRQEEFKKVLVFGRTKHGVERVARDLFQKGFKVTSIHGDKAQFQRQQAIRMFKEDVVSIMVATDVAARGLDIANVTHVINYDIPQTYEDYIHRIGRTGRANLNGTALTFVEE